jgi:hypothetical protein
LGLEVIDEVRREVGGVALVAHVEDMLSVPGDPQ